MSQMSLGQSIMSQPDPQMFDIINQILSRNRKEMNLSNSDLSLDLSFSSLVD